MFKISIKGSLRSLRSRPELYVYSRCNRPQVENGWIGEEKDFAPWKTPAVTKAMLQLLCVILELSLKILHPWEYSVERDRAGTGINGRGYKQILKHISLR